jgi:hypothetical protein
MNIDVDSPDYDHAQLVSFREGLQYDHESEIPPMETGLGGFDVNPCLASYSRSGLLTSFDKMLVLAIGA